MLARHLMFIRQVSSQSYVLSSSVMKSVTDFWQVISFPSQDFQNRYFASIYTGDNSIALTSTRLLIEGCPLKLVLSSDTIMRFKIEHTWFWHDLNILFALVLVQNMKKVFANSPCFTGKNLKETLLAAADTLKLETDRSKGHLIHSRKLARFLRTKGFWWIIRNSWCCPYDSFHHGGQNWLKKALAKLARKKEELENS